VADSYEFIMVQGEELTPSQLVWRRYQRPAPGILGQFLDANPHLAEFLNDTPFVPHGTVVRMPIDDRVLAGKPRILGTVRMSGEAG
jgi:phage tail protein X